MAKYKEAKETDIKVRLSAEVKEQLRKLAAEEGENNISLIVRRAVNQYLDVLAAAQQSPPSRRPASTSHRRASAA